MPALGWINSNLFFFNLVRLSYLNSKEGQISWLMSCAHPYPEGRTPIGQFHQNCRQWERGIPQKGRWGAMTRRQRMDFAWTEQQIPTAVSKEIFLLCIPDLGLQWIASLPYPPTQSNRSLADSRLSRNSQTQKITGLRCTCYFSKNNILTYKSFQSCKN